MLRPWTQQPWPFQVVFSRSKPSLSLSPSAALAILPSPTKPLHKAFGKRTDLTPPFHAFSSSYNLMLIKTSAQGLATYQDKENTGTLLSHSTSMQQDMLKSSVLCNKYDVHPLVLHNLTESNIFPHFFPRSVFSGERWLLCYNWPVGKKTDFLVLCISDTDCTKRTERFAQGTCAILPKCKSVPCSIFFSCNSWHSCYIQTWLDCRVAPPISCQILRPICWHTPCQVFLPMKIPFCVLAGISGPWKEPSHYQTKYMKVYVVILLQWCNAVLSELQCSQERLQSHREAV